MLRLMLMLLAFVWSLAASPDDPPPADDGDPPPADDGKDKKPAPYKEFGSKKELDDFVSDQVQDRLRRKDQKLEDEKERIEREAREKALADNESWKELAQTHAETIEKQNKKIDSLNTKITELEGEKERVGSLETRLKGIIAPKLEQVPELFRPFVDAMGVEEQAEWFEKNADKLDPAEEPTDDTTDTTDTQRPAGQPPTGRAAPGGPDKQKDKEAAEEQKEAGISRI